jgi:hypothetical protein
MTLVAATNIRGSDQNLISGARYRTYSVKSMGHKLDSLASPCFDVPLLQKKTLSLIRRIGFNLMQDRHMFHIAVITVPYNHVELNCLSQKWVQCIAYYNLLM